MEAYMEYFNMSQEYDKYDKEALEVWQLLYNRQIKLLPGLADDAFLEGIELVGFSANKIPKFEEVNANLEKITGWKLVVVPGLIPNQPFFQLLENKFFPATTWLRKMEELDYLEEPDMFHDVFGHVPLLSNQDFVNFLSALSSIALKHIDNEWIVEIVSRLYWYTVEFGLIKTEKGMRIYGAGILSSSGESVYCLSEKAQPLYRPFDVKTILDTPYIKDRFQEIYFVIDSYKQLYESIPTVAAYIEQVAKEGKVA